MNWSVEYRKMARCLNFCIQVEKELYYLCSENKGADQLCSNCTADLRLFFRRGKIRFSHDAVQFSMRFLMRKMNLRK